MSMTSRSYRFFRCCSQIRLIFSTASADFDVDPLTYKRKTYLAWPELEPHCSNSPANPGFRFPAGLLFFGGGMWALLNWVSLPFADPGRPTAASCWTGLQRLFGVVAEAFLPGSELLRSGRRAPVADSSSGRSLRSDSGPSSALHTSP